MLSLLQTRDVRQPVPGHVRLQLQSGLLAGPPLPTQALQERNLEEQEAEKGGNFLGGIFLHQRPASPLKRLRRSGPQRPSCDSRASDGRDDWTRHQWRGCPEPHQKGEVRPLLDGPHRGGETEELHRGVGLVPPGDVHPLQYKSGGHRQGRGLPFLQYCHELLILFIFY